MLARTNFTFDMFNFWKSDNANLICQTINKTNHEPVGKDDVIFALYYGIAIFIISLICIIGNCMIIHALICSPGLRGAQHWFVMSLAVSDIIQGAAVPIQTMGHSMKTVFIPNLDKWKNCQTLIFVMVSSQMISALNLVGITVIRYMAIRRPLDFKARCDRNKRKMAMAISSCWLTGIATSMMLYLRPNKPPNFCEGIVGSCRTEIIYEKWNVLVFAIINVALPVLVMMSFYLHGMTLINRQRDELRQFSGAASAIDSTQRISQTATFLLGFYIITWMPLLVYESVFMSCATCKDVRYVRATCRIIYFSNVAVNVFVYAGRIQQFKQAFKQDVIALKSAFCCCCERCSKVEEADISGHSKRLSVRKLRSLGHRNDNKMNVSTVSVKYKRGSEGCPSLPGNGSSSSLCSSFGITEISQL